MQAASRYTIHKTGLPNGCNVAYIDEGEGVKTLLFIHGLATYGLSWRKNIEQLKHHYRCIAIDLPGNGFSDRGDYAYSIAFFADTVYQFISVLKLNNVCLIGHSMGGQIAITTLLQHPECANSLVLCAPAGFEIFTPWEKSISQSSVNFLNFFSTEENSLRQSVHNSFYRYQAQADEMVNELVGLMKQYPIRVYRAMIEACIYSMLQEPVFDRLHMLQHHTLVLYGDYDALIPNRLIHPVSTRQIAEAGTGQIPNATLHMIPQCGHFLQWEQAEVVNGIVRSFLG